jgi:hypothetical protein
LTSLQQDYILASEGHYFQHLDENYTQFAPTKCVRHVASLPVDLSRGKGVIMFNFPVRKEGSPLAYNPATGAAVSKAMRFFVGSSMVNISAEDVRASMVVLDAAPIEADVNYGPYKQAPKLAEDALCHAKRAACAAEARQLIATASGVPA